MPNGGEVSMLERPNPGRHLRPKGRCKGLLS
jgi:hypothetical protein